MNIEEFSVAAGKQRLRCSLASPDSTRAREDSCLLLNVSATAQYALHDSSQNHPTTRFLDAGHYVLSFDLPHHGERVSPYGENLEGMAKAFLAGDDPFEQFIVDGKAAVDGCWERGIGRGGKVVGYGVSRAGYCLLRLFAADRRVEAVAGLSPVTDWGLVDDFTEFCPPSQTGPLMLEHWIEQLADRAVYLCIGSQDDVVGTESCVRFAMKLFRKQRATLATDTLLNELHVVNSPQHSPAKFWRLDATRFLLQYCESARG